MLLLDSTTPMQGSAQRTRFSERRGTPGRAAREKENARLRRPKPKRRRKRTAPLLRHKSSTPRRVVAGGVACVLAEDLDLAEFEEALEEPGASAGGAKGQ